MTQKDSMILKIDIEKLGEILRSLKRNYEDDNILIKVRKTQLPLNVLCKI